ARPPVHRPAGFQRPACGVLRRGESALSPVAGLRPGRPDRRRSGGDDAAAAGGTGGWVAQFGSSAARLLRAGRFQRLFGVPGGDRPPDRGGDRPGPGACVLRRAARPRPPPGGGPPPDPPPPRALWAGGPAAPGPAAAGPTAGRPRGRGAAAGRLRHRARARRRWGGVMATAKTATRDVTPEGGFLTRAGKGRTLRESVARLAERARAENWSHEESLAACLQREVSARES